VQRCHADGRTKSRRRVAWLLNVNTELGKMQKSGERERERENPIRRFFKGEGEALKSRDLTSRDWTTRHQMKQIATG